nr:immunoglobulin heavy chain junction region [Macaca mulatta]
CARDHVRVYWSETDRFHFGLDSW